LVFIPLGLVFLVLGLLLVKENIFSHVYNVMLGLVKVPGHVTGQVNTNALFTVCYKSRICLELSKFLLSFVCIVTGLVIGLVSSSFFIFWYSQRSGLESFGHMRV